MTANKSLTILKDPLIGFSVFKAGVKNNSDGLELLFS